MDGKTCYWYRAYAEDEQGGITQLLWKHDPPERHGIAAAFLATQPNLNG